MHDVLQANLEQLTMGEGTRHENMTVYPLMEARAVDVDYLLLDQALEGGLVGISEVSSSGSVPELRFENRADKPVLVIDGEELVGAKQNRIVNVTMLIAAQATIVIPVSCVEQGRWSYDRPDFGSEGRMFSSRGRARKTSDVSDSVRGNGEFSADQSAVWDEVDAKSSRLGTASVSRAMSGVYEQQRGHVEEYVAAFEAQAHQNGVLVTVDGAIAGLDLFNKPETLVTLLPKLTASYALDALETVKPGHPYHRPNRRARAFLETVREASTTRHPSVSLGEDARWLSDLVVGAALVHEGAVLHLCAFPKDESSGARVQGRMRRATERQRRY